MRFTIVAAACLSLALCSGPESSARAQSQPPTRREARGPEAGPAGRRAPGPSAADQSDSGLPPLPADRTTQHTVKARGQTISFSATAGVLRLANAQNGAPLADVAYIAFQKDGADSSRRPVAFVFNGGPGYASGWLNLGGLGPWRLPMQGAADAPSAAPVTIDNEDSWLDFADLVFIDPPGTGYSRVLGGEDAQKALWSINGDVNALATAVRRWVEQNNRMDSPKYLVGESYGGFRAPKIAHELAVNQGVGIAGVVMISPVLDFSAFGGEDKPMSYVSDLPSMAAVAREVKHPISRKDLADVESYATGDFLSDLMKGPDDAAAIARLSTKVASFTGLDANLVRRLGGRVSLNQFRRAFWRAEGKIASQYDGTVAGYDPTPFAGRSNPPDQLRLGLNAPITEAMVELFHQKLDWVVPRGRYLFFNEQAGRTWEYGRNPEAISDLREDLALDPNFRVLIAHGLTDLVTPYFRTQLEIGQIPNYGPPGRLALKVYPGGHMVYIRDGSRQSLHDDARAMVAGRPQTTGPQTPASNPGSGPAPAHP